MSNLNDKLLHNYFLPIKICFVVGKIVLFPVYCVYRFLRMMWEDIHEFGSELWYDWYRRG